MCPSLDPRFAHVAERSRMTGNPEVIHASVGLVSTNTLTRQVKSR
jgi:hypothetical protein